MKSVNTTIILYNISFESIIVIHLMIHNLTVYRGAQLVSYGSHSLAAEE